MSNTDTLQEQRKNKKEMEFELKLAKEKEEMHEREKQLKISRLVQEVCGGGAEEQALSSAAYIGYFIDQRASMREGLTPVVWCCLALTLYQVSETEREDLEESEKVQHWVERLCQTRLEQISCVENESPEVQSETSSVWM